MGSLSLEIMPWYMSAHFKEGIWVLECLSSKHEALSSNHSTARKKKKLGTGSQAKSKILSQKRTAQNSG
jgi:hypothetical protein